MKTDRQRVPLSAPDVGEQEIELVTHVLRSPYLSMGPMIQEFEVQMARVAGVKYGVAVNSGTSGLHLVVKALGIGPGHEVITTAFSFVASSNILLYEGARPVFVDIKPDTLNLDPDLVESTITPRTKAILVVDVFGHPADYSNLEPLARKYGLALIEDSCEAIGASYRGRPAGGFGCAGIFAFYPNKQMTTGEGGVIVTDSEEIAELARSMRNQGRGRSGQWLEHVRLGYNYRMSELNAALGVAQARRLPELLAARQRVAALYKEALSGIPGVTLPYQEPEVTVSWFVYVIRLDPQFDRDRVMALLAERGVDSRPYFRPIHLQEFYMDQLGTREGTLPTTEDVARRTVALPFFNRLTRDQIAYVAECLAEVLPLASR